MSPTPEKAPARASTTAPGENHEQPQDATTTAEDKPIDRATQEAEDTKRIRLIAAPPPEEWPDLTKFGESDADNALRVDAVAGGNFHYVAESGKWLVWDGQRWSTDRDGKIVRLWWWVV